MENKKVVQIKVASPRGHDVISLPPQEAVAELQRLEREEHKWVFVDGKMTNTSRLTAEAIGQAEDIFVSEALKGGGF